MCPAAFLFSPAGNFGYPDSQASGPGRQISCLPVRAKPVFALRFHCGHTLQRGQIIDATGRCCCLFPGYALRTRHTGLSGCPLSVVSQASNGPSRTRPPCSAQTCLQNMSCRRKFSGGMTCCGKNRFIQNAGSHIPGLPRGITAQAYLRVISSPAFSTSSRIFARAAASLRLRSASARARI